MQLKSKIKHFALALLVLNLIGCILPTRVWAGFGIAPSDIINKYLKPGAHLEKVIILSRSDPDEELTAVIETNLGDIESWFSFKPGRKFKLPIGETRVPLHIIIDVPEDAEIKKYEGAISIKAKSADEEVGGVSIVKGAKMQVDLVTTHIDLNALLVRMLEIEDVPGNQPIALKMKIENQGNTEIGPTKVVLQVSDLNNQLIMELDTDDIETIPPYETKETFAYFKANLEKGDYFGRVKIYYDDQLLREEKLTFRVLGRLTAAEISKSISEKTLRSANLIFPHIILILLIALSLLAIANLILLLVKIKKNKKYYQEQKRQIKKRMIVLITLTISSALLATSVFLFIKNKQTDPPSEEQAAPIEEEGEPEIEQINLDSEVKGVSTETLDLSDSPDPTQPPENTDQTINPLVEKNEQGETVYKIYEKPNFNSEVIYTAKEGETFFVYEELSEWYHVSLNQIKSGWLPKNNVKIINQVITE